MLPFVRRPGCTVPNRTSCASKESNLEHGLAGPLCFQPNNKGRTNCLSSKGNGSELYAQIRRFLGREKRALDGSPVCVASPPLICLDAISPQWSRNSDAVFIWLILKQNLTIMKLLTNKAHSKCSLPILDCGKTEPTKAFSVLTQRAQKGILRRPSRRHRWKAL